MDAGNCDDAVVVVGGCVPVADSDKELLLRASSARERLAIAKSLAESVTEKMGAMASDISSGEDKGDAEDID